MKLGQFVKIYNPSIYYQIQQWKFIRRLPEKYHSGIPMTFVMKDRQAGFFSLFFQVLGAADFCRKQGHNLILDFCDSIVQLLEDEHLRKQMEINCRNIAVTEYFIELQSQRYIEIYQQVLKN